MQLLYGGSAFKFYTLEVAKLLANSQQLRLKLDSSSTNLKRLCEQAQAQIGEMRPIAKAREDARIMYDHYRHKVNNLETTVSKDKNKEP